ncbi:MAG: DUF480 domain-containing protein [Actinomycetota bacterium]
MTDFTAESQRRFLQTSEPDDPGAEGVGSETWTPERARLLGALIEKALATPQNYPLSVNALVAACNQTTNRDPIMELSESAVEGLLAEAKADGWARYVHPRSGRGVTKYRHVVDEKLGLDDRETALVGVLALRGPQTVSELRSRTERLAPMDTDELESVLAGLAQRSPTPLARRLERESGHREPRWIQLLCSAQGEERAGEPSSASPRRAVAAGSVGEGEADELRTELAQVRAELAALRGEFEAFRAEFG